jgi:NodT family efflux transporter outer membrane factor (OMF) lipoprotein
MLIALFARIGNRIEPEHMRVLFHPRTTLKASARSIREGFVSLLRVEVAVWALLQTAAVWMAIATAMLLAGCASFGGAHTESKAIDATSLAVTKTFGQASVATWPRDDWWKQFHDPGLDALIDEGLADGNAISLRLAEARLRGAQAVVRGAESRELPSLGLNASTTREHFSENFIYPPPLGGSTYNINSGTLDFKYELDLWGRNRAAIGTARSQARVAEADRQAARLALSTSLARAWFQLQRLSSVRDVTEQAIRQRTDVLALARQRFDAGLDTNAELRQAEAQLPAARVDLAQIDESIGLVRNQIAALLGKGPDRGRGIGVPQGVSSAVVALPASLPAELVGRRPEIVAARWRVEAARGQIESARAEFYPNIDLVASAGFIALGASQFLKAGSRNWSGGPALTLPIFEGGRLRANLAGRNADYDVAVEQYNSAVVDAVRDVADQVIAMQSVVAQIDDQHLARVKTEEAYDVAVIRYRAGLTTYLTVLNALTSVLQQERADAELRARILDVDVTLIRALGGGYHVDDESDAPIAARAQ